MAGQVYEFTTFYREGLGYTTSLFGSSFYTLTGFHGVHVSVGIMMLMALMFMLLAQQGVRRQGRDGRDDRPLLALRRHRLDHHLHPRLPDSGLTMTLDTASTDAHDSSHHGSPAGTTAHRRQVHEASPTARTSRSPSRSMMLTAAEIAVSYMDIGKFRCRSCSS